jgi:hypothetical protein
MAFSDDRWTTAFPCEPMFEESLVEKERQATLNDYHDISDYFKNRLMACYPCWWDNVESGREEECELMCQHFLDPSSQQFVPRLREDEDRHSNCSLQWNSRW